MYNEFGENGDAPSGLCRSSDWDLQGNKHAKSLSISPCPQTNLSNRLGRFQLLFYMTLPLGIIARHFLPVFHWQLRKWTMHSQSTKSQFLLCYILPCVFTELLHFSVLFFKKCHAPFLDTSDIPFLWCWSAIEFLNSRIHAFKSPIAYNIIYIYILLVYIIVSQWAII